MDCKCVHCGHEWVEQTYFTYRKCPSCRVRVYTTDDCHPHWKRHYGLSAPAGAQAPAPAPKQQPAPSAPPTGPAPAGTPIAEQFGEIAAIAKRLAEQKMLARNAERPVYSGPEHGGKKLRHRSGHKIDFPI